MSHVSAATLLKALLSTTMPKMTPTIPSPSTIGQLCRAQLARLSRACACRGLMATSSWMMTLSSSDGSGPLGVSSISDLPCSMRPAAAAASAPLGSGPRP